MFDIASQLGLYPGYIKSNEGCRKKLNRNEQSRGTDLLKWNFYVWLQIVALFYICLVLLILGTNLCHKGREPTNKVRVCICTVHVHVQYVRNVWRISLYVTDVTVAKLYVS